MNGTALNGKTAIIYGAGGLGGSSPPFIAHRPTTQPATSRSTP